MAKLNKWYRHISWIAQYVESVDVTKWPVSMLLACISMWNLHCATFSHSFHWRAMLWNAPHIQFSCNAFASFHEANLSMYCMILIGWRANCTLKMSERRASLTDTPTDQHGAILIFQIRVCIRQSFGSSHQPFVFSQIKRLVRALWSTSISS